MFKERTAIYVYFLLFKKKKSLNPASTQIPGVILSNPGGFENTLCVASVSLLTLCLHKPVILQFLLRVLRSLPQTAARSQTTRSLFADCLMHISHKPRKQLSQSGKL